MLENKEKGLKEERIKNEREQETAVKYLSEEARHEDAE
jgi:hypothetical protein